MPRKRGNASPRETFPLISALGREQFDRSVNIASHDRWAILSFLIGAKSCLGWDEAGGILGRKLIYHLRVKSLAPEIRADPALVSAAKILLPCASPVVCHVASSQPKKEWPLAHWAQFYKLASAADWSLVFTTARGEREAALMAELKNLVPGAVILSPILELPLFLAVLARAAVFISGDTGPLHFAAGLGVPIISLFGPTLPSRWAPIGTKHVALSGSACGCDGNLFACASPQHCLAEINPERVYAALCKMAGEN